MKKKILVFGDVGIDDAIALIYAFLNEEIEIVGIVADYGNVSREAAIANVHYLLSSFNRLTIPVIGGAEIPMTGEEPTFYPEIHGQYGLGPIEPGIYEGIIENFHEVVDIINKYPNELIIVNTGRLTSLATMFILFRALMSKVKAFYIMGGAFWVPGNVTAVSEANFFADPIAAKIVFTYAHNLTIIPLNATQEAIVTPEMTNYIDYQGRANVKPLLDYYYTFYKSRDPEILGTPVHDALTIMAVIHEDMFTFTTLPVHVNVSGDGIERGQSIVDIRPYIEFEEDARPHRIAFSLNYQLFFNDFMTVMTGETFR